MEKNQYFDMDILDVPYAPMVNYFSTRSNRKYLKDLDRWQLYIETMFDRCLVKGMPINEANPTLNLSPISHPTLVDDAKKKKELLDTNTFFLECCLYETDSVSGDFCGYEFRNVFNNGREICQFLLSLTKFMNTPNIVTDKVGMLPTITAMAKMNPNLYDIYKYFKSYKGKRSAEIVTNKNCEMEFVYYDIMKSYLQQTYNITKITKLFKDKVMVKETKDSTIHFYVSSFNTVVVMEWKFYIDKDTNEAEYCGNGEILWLDYASLIQPNLSPIIYRIPISNVVHPKA